jgi:NADH dehydrogenase
MLLLTGATGFVGSHLARRLVADGWEVRCLVRKPEQAPDFLRQNCELFPGDILQPSGLSAALRGVEGIIHLVGIIRESRGVTFEKVHGQGTRNLLQAAREAGVTRFVHMSALGARPEAASRYHQSKWAAETAVRNHGLAYTVFRPSVIFGPEDQFINLLLKMIPKLPVLPHFGWGNVQPIWVEDVVTCFCRSLNDAGAVGRSFNLAGPKIYSLDELFDLLSRRLGKSKPHLTPPQWLLWAGAKMLELTPHPPLTREQLLMLGEDNVADIGAMVGCFGLSPRSLENYLQELEAAEPAA